jgi:transposase-like protein
MIGKAKRAQYTLEFKLEAVRLVKNGQSMAAVAARTASISTVRRIRSPTTVASARSIPGSTTTNSSRRITPTRHRNAGNAINACDASRPNIDDSPFA